MFLCATIGKKRYYKSLSYAWGFDDSYVLYLEGWARPANRARLALDGTWPASVDDATSGNRIPRRLSRFQPVMESATALRQASRINKSSGGMRLSEDSRSGEVGANQGLVQL